MPKKRKPITGEQPAKGLKSGTAEVNNCLYPTTSPQAIQLFGTFDHDTKNAVIILARWFL